LTDQPDRQKSDRINTFLFGEDTPVKMPIKMYITITAAVVGLAIWLVRLESAVGQHEKDMARLEQWLTKVSERSR
jgi:hypothetical protein